MRKNKMMRLASGLLVAVLLTTSMISGTFAKYISEASGEDSARVAKWSFQVGGKDIAAKNEVTFDLFATIVDTVLVDGQEVADTDVDEQLIAPGTKGRFDIVLTNASEVTAKYAIAFEETIDQDDKDIPIQYSLDGVTWKNTVAELNMTAGESTTLPTALKATKENPATKTVTVYWQWAFETGAAVEEGMTEQKEGDATDTALGIAMPTVTVKATITATQVD